MTKKIVKINEMQLRNLVAETIERIAEDTKAQRKKGPMNQWFKDADKLSRLRDMSNPTYDAERQKNIDKALKESGDTRRGSYMKGRTIGRKMAKGDTSTVGKDNLGNYPEMGELGMKDQYGYEMAAKNSGLFGNPFKADERLQDIQDRYERLKHDDKFFGDWDKHINGQLNEAQLRDMIAESVKKVLKEGTNTFWYHDEEYPEFDGKNYELMEQLNSLIRTIIITIEQFDEKIPDDFTYWNVLLTGPEWRNLCKSLNAWVEYLKPLAVKYGWEPAELLPIFT